MQEKVVRNLRHILSVIWNLNGTGLHSFQQNGGIMFLKLSLHFQRIFFLLISLLSLGINAPAVFGDAEITGIEINQALGNQYKKHQNFVAGKNTVIRVFMSEPVTISKRTKQLGAAVTKAVAKKDGEIVAELGPKSYNKPTKIIDFLCPDMEDCGNWASGTYDFEVTVLGNTVVKEDVVFKSRRTFKILAVPLKTNYSGKVMEYPDQKWKTLWKFTRDVYPIAADALDWVEREQLDLSNGRKYDLNTDNGQKNAWKALRNLNPTHCPPVGRTPGEDCYDSIIGFIPKNLPDSVGFTMGQPASIATGTDSDAAATVAHETAHLFEIGDTYDGGHLNCPVNPAPNGWEGKDWNDETKTVSCKAGAVGYEDLGTKILASSHPYDVNGRGPLGDMADYMGRSASPEQLWTTPETYDWLFSQFAPKTELAAGIAGAAQRVIAYSGFIKAADDTITLDPWTSYYDSSNIPDTIGTFTIEALSSTGKVLASQALSMNFFVPTDPPRRLPLAAFQGTMRFPDGAVRFQIVKGSKVLSSRAVNAKPPSISAVTPTVAGASMTGIHNITWNYKNPMGATLTYKVEYNPDTTKTGSDWEVLVSELGQNKWKQDFDELPGGDHAQIRVTATDGVNGVSALSAVFSVPPKPPEIFIGKLEWGDDYEVGDEVLLEAEAYDSKDGWLPDNKIVWSSNISGVLGKGSILVVENLDPGEHIITATATNSSHQSAADHVELTVSSCSFEQKPDNLSFQSQGGDQTVQVTASQSAGKTAVCSLTDDDLATQTYDDRKWLSARVTGFVNNKGTLQISVLPNDSAYVRTGSVLVMGNVVDVSQDAAQCDVGINPTQVGFHSLGGTGQIEVSAPRGCVLNWTAISDSKWIEVTSGSKGTGDGTVGFKVLPSTAWIRRTGHININGKAINILQSPGRSGV